MKADPLRVVEAFYAPEPDEAVWVREVLDALSPAARGFWTAAGRVAIACEPRDRLRVLAARGVSVEHLEPPFRSWWARAPDPLVRMAANLQLPVAELASERFWAREPQVYETFRRVYEGVGARDSLALVAPAGAGQSVQLHVGVPPGGRPPPPRTRRQLSSVLPHLAAALRLRGALTGIAAGPDSPLTEAVLDPTGRIAHLAPVAQGPATRGRLVSAVRRMERARGRLRWTSPEEALALWDALVDGRWSLVDHVESDGRRWVLARKNPMGARDPRALTAAERAVLAHAVEGRSNKHIAAELGIAPSTVADRLRACQAKLLVPSRRALIDLLAAAPRPLYEERACPDPAARSAPIS